MYSSNIQADKYFVLVATRVKDSDQNNKAEAEETEETEDRGDEEESPPPDEHLKYVPQQISHRTSVMLYTNGSSNEATTKVTKTPTTSCHGIN
jgi:hypothetical protein